MQYGLIGEHLPHSFSKVIHEEIGLYEYELCELAPREIDEFMTKREFKGINVTIPYKQTVIPYLDEISDRAKSIGAVNTIVNRDGKLYGDNTDLGGMIALIKKTGISLDDKKVLILGTGGTSKTAFAAAKSLEAKRIYKVSRSKTDGALSYDEMYENHKDAEVIINTTPGGMYPNFEGCPAELSGFKELEGVVDVIYNPLSTRLVQQARELDVKAGGGLYMLVSQAVLAAELFTGTKLPKDMTDRIYNKLLREKMNIVLVGMPGSGKTTIGRKLSEKLGIELVDSDDVIIRERRVLIPKIFAERGEKGFREIESDVIKRISRLNGKIIATGGGAVLNEENVRNLKGNGIVIFIDRDIKKIRTTSDRPLSNSEDKLKALYEKRYPIYKRAADIHLKVNGTASDAACDIIKKLDKLIEG